MAEHQEGKVVYTCTRLPVTPVYEEKFASEAEAVAREKQIKGWTRRKKEALIESRASDLKRLAKKIWKSRLEHEL